VIEATGACVEGATVQLIVGNIVVQSATQTDPCDTRDYGGIIFNELPAGELTLRASAPGYATQDTTGTATFGRSAVGPLIIQLRKTGA